MVTYTEQGDYLVSHVLDIGVNTHLINRTLCLSVTFVSR